MIERIRIVGEVAVVTATADFHPLRRVNLIAHELLHRCFRGVVLFDLLAVNGNAPNRFVSMKFGNSGFDRASFAVESNVSASIKSEQDILAGNSDTFLLGSVLSSSEVRTLCH